MQGAAVLPEKDEEETDSQERTGEVPGEEPDERFLQPDSRAGFRRTGPYDRETKQRFSGRTARSGPAPGDVPEVRAEDHQAAANEDAEEGPIAQEVRRLERLPEEKDEKDGGQEEEIQRQEDDRVDERGQDARKEPRGLEACALAVRGQVRPADPDRRGRPSP